MEDWVKVGAEVASVGFGQRKSVTFSRINRIGRMWLFLDNGEKFHILGLDRSEGKYGGQIFKLFPPDHPRVLDVKYELEAKKIMGDAIRLAKKFVESPNTSNAEQVVLALLPFTTFQLADQTDTEQ